MEKPKIESVEDMPMYRPCFRLAVDMERATRRLGPDFRGLRLQMLKSSQSVCANMAEGFYSQYSTEYLQALYRCRREARGTATDLRYAMDAQPLDEAAGNHFLRRYGDGAKQLANLISSIARKIRDPGIAKPGPVRARAPESDLIAH